MIARRRAGARPVKSTTAQATGQRWSDPATWSGSKPIAGDNVTLAAGATIILDESPPALGVLTWGAGAKLRADPAVGALTLTAAGMVGMSAPEIHVGSAATPFTNNFTFELTGSRASASLVSRSGAPLNGTEGAGFTGDASARGLNMMNPVISIYGRKLTKTWMKINAHAAAGANTLTMEDAAALAEWNVGDEIAVLPTGWYGATITERFTIASKAGAVITLGPKPGGGATTLATARYGRLQYIVKTAVGVGTVSETDDGSYTPAVTGLSKVQDSRAVVQNLTRNIKFQGPDDSDWQTNGFGAHAMFMGPNAKVEIDSVEFRRTGQRGVMGRYPIHWHMNSYTPATGAFTGDLTNNWARSCSVHESENRGAVLHGVCGVELSDNVFSEIKTSCIFLEDHSERRNLIQRNAISRVTGHSVAGNRLRNFDGEGFGIWQTNPDNRTLNNHCGDIDAKGIIQVYPDVISGSTGGCMGDSRLVNIVPRYMQILEFAGNTIHTTGSQGMRLSQGIGDQAGTITEQQYQPRAGGIAGGAHLIPVFTDINIWKCGANDPGGYANRVHSPHYVEWVVCDNNGNDFQGAVQENTFLDRVTFIGASLNATGSPAAPKVRAGVASYHTAGVPRDSVFVNYPGVDPGTPAFNTHESLAGGAIPVWDLYLRTIEVGFGRATGNEFLSTLPYWPLKPPNPDPANPGFGYNGVASSAFQNGETQYHNRTINVVLPDWHGWLTGDTPSINPRNVIFDNAFLTHDIGDLAAIQVGKAWQSGVAHYKATATHFFGLDNFWYEDYNRTNDGSTEPDAGTREFTPRMAVEVSRRSLSNADTQVATWSIPDALESAQGGLTPGFIVPFRHVPIANGGRYVLTMPHPSVKYPNQFLRIQISNCYRSGDGFWLAVPWSGAVAPSAVWHAIDNGRVNYGTRTLSGEAVGAGTARVLTTTGSRANALADTTASVYYRDTPNNLLWMHVKALPGGAGDWTTINFATPATLSDSNLAKPFIIYVKA